MGNKLGSLEAMGLSRSRQRLILEQAVIDDIEPFSKATEGYLRLIDFVKKEFGMTIRRCVLAHIFQQATVIRASDLSLEHRLLIMGEANSLNGQRFTETGSKILRRFAARELGKMICGPLMGQIIRQSSPATFPVPTAEEVVATNGHLWQGSCSDIRSAKQTPANLPA